MGIIGPNAKVRVDGRGDHDLATLEWTVTRTKTPFTPIGSKYPDRYTAGVVECTFSGTVQSKPGGTFAIDWDSWSLEDQSKPIVADSGGRKERMIDVVVDEVSNTVSNDDGTFQKQISGKFKRPRYE